MLAKVFMASSMGFGVDKSTPAFFNKFCQEAGGREAVWKRYMIMISNPSNKSNMKPFFALKKEPVSYTRTGFLFSLNLLSISSVPSILTTRFMLYARYDNAISALTEIFLLVRK